MLSLTTTPIYPTRNASNYTLYPTITPTTLPHLFCSPPILR